MFRPAFPKVPNGGTTNAVVSTQPLAPRWESAGLRRMLGRSLAPKPSDEMPVLLLSWSESSATVNGRPGWKVQMPTGCQAGAQSPPDSGLQALVIRIAARFDDVDVGELRDWTRIRLLRAGQRLIEIARANQLAEIGRAHV